MATAGDVIAGALRLIGAVAAGETVNGNDGADGLEAFNGMLDSWSAERLSVFCTQDQTFTWPANTISRTLGPSGDFVGNRPVLVDDSTYFKVNNVSYGIKPINRQQYDAIALKTATSTFPQVMYVNMTMPDVEMFVYPVPTSVLEMHIVSVEELSQPATLATELVFPPGYERAFRFNLACELAPEYGVEPPPRVQRIADVSKRTLKRINNPMDVMAMPYALIARQQRYNIFTNE
jgi:hypothetical protein